jgi:hypothetical protein
MKWMQKMMIYQEFPPNFAGKISRRASCWTDSAGPLDKSCLPPGGLKRSTNNQSEKVVTHCSSSKVGRYANARDTTDGEIGCGFNRV